jgi:hypothetical protein
MTRIHELQALRNELAEIARNVGNSGIDTESELFAIIIKIDRKLNVIGEGE